MTAAQDAFGTSVGDETIGLYSGSDVRGFSAFAAGNVRIEGLYFDLQGFPVDQVEAGSSIRVGIAALGYPFPAPTGIVDLALRRAGDKPVVSARAGFGQYFGPLASVDAALPLTGSLGVNAGVSAELQEYLSGGDPWFLRYGTVARWRPARGLELTGFFSRYDYGDEEIGPIIFTAGRFLPPKYQRRRFFGQEWSEWAGHAQTYGAIAKLERGPWRAAVGAFNSRFTQDDYAAAFLLDTDRAGVGRRRVIAGRDQRFASTSGEARLARDFTEGPRLHRLLASIRARRVDDRYGGFDAADLGPGVAGVPDPEPRPAFGFGPLTRDRVTQDTGSLGYELRWSGVGELNLGVQKTAYAKTVLQPGRAAQTRSDRPWLWNAAVALTMIDDLALYAATTRGLEESGTAPPSAANANEPLPALRTKQAELGLRYRFSGNMRLIVGLFEVQKPYFEIDRADGVFRVLGQVRHRGAEISLSGKPLAGLNLVAGAVLLRPRVTGVAVEDGRLGSRPLGRTGTLLDLRLDYRLPRLDALSLDLGIVYTGRRVARVDNTLYVPERLTLDLGGRYRFRAGGAPATLRVQVRNLTDNYSWLVLGGGAYQPTFARSLVASLAADF